VARDVCLVSQKRAMHFCRDRRETAAVGDGVLTTSELSRRISVKVKSLVKMLISLVNDV